MKFKKNIFYSFLIVTIVLSFSSIIYASSSSKNTVHTDTEKKIDIMLDDAHSNLKEIFGIDEKSYKKVKYDDLNDLNSGKIAEFKDKKFGTEAAQLIYSAKKDFPLGYTIPVIYIKNDKSEIILCAKNEAGESMMITLKANNKVNTLTTDNNNTWEKNKEQKQGKPNLKIEDIQLNN